MLYTERISIHWRGEQNRVFYCRGLAIHEHLTSVKSHRESMEYGLQAECMRTTAVYRYEMLRSPYGFGQTFKSAATSKEENKPSGVM